MKALPSICLCIACFACHSGQMAEPDMDVIVREQIPLDTAFSPPPTYRLRSSQTGTVLIISARSRDQISLISTDHQRSVLKVADSVLRASNAGFLGDSMWIADDASRRILFWSGRPRRWSQMLTPTVQPGAQTAVLGILVDGTAIVQSRPPGTSGGAVATLLIAVDDRSASVVDSLTTIGGEINLSGVDGDGTVTLRQPWLFEDLALVSRDGRLLTTLRQRRSQPGEINVNRYRAVHERATSQTLRFKPMKLDEVAVRSWLHLVMQDSLERFLGGRVRAEAQLRAALFQPLHLPAIRRAVGGSHDSLLLERVANDSMHHWEIWDEEGHFKGSFVLRPAMELQDASDSTIWAITRSRAAAETLVVATIRPLARGAANP